MYLLSTLAILGVVFAMLAALTALIRSAYVHQFELRAGSKPNACAAAQIKPQGSR
jgi:hypothetical protein